MTPAILGRKVGMTQVYDPEGQVVPVTVIQAGPCTVLQIKTAETDGYEAVQLGYLDAKPHCSTKPMIGHCQRAGTGPKRWVGEVRLGEPTEVKPGDVVTVEVFESQSVQFVDVVGTTKGRGFTGGVKRFGFGGQPASHGTERKHRSPGGIGAHADRGRGRNVKKGKHMAGHYGVDRRTSKNHRLVAVDKENHLMLVKGSIPGPPGGYVLVKRAKSHDSLTRHR
jgi:large subunit ribosomal protein L3